MRRIILAVAALLLCAGFPCHAGGPAFVAGSGYDPGVKGQPLIWANGNIVYYTDQGDLSPILNNSGADAFVAAALASWTSLPYVALAATPGGHLAEDVNGTNVIGYPDGTYSIPPDIQPTALTTPVGIVYDYDGAVTDAILGAGAGDAGNCFSNAVYGGPDNFSAAGNIVHALLVINGVCAASNSQLPDVQYRLVRTLGRILGLGWSQANLNAQTGGPPPPVFDDFEGFSLMHYYDSIACVPISLCYPDAAVPKLDDRAAMGRLYPVTPDNQGGFPGKQVFGQQTARIHGSVYFTDASGNPAQPMQGVNVVARWIDAGGKPSRQYVATAVSGFAFRGNAGNIINGYADAHGSRYDRFGSDDPALEGFFDLAGLEIPGGNPGAQYQLSVEAVDENWSEGVGPYAPSQVAPSGKFPPVTVTVQLGTDVANDIWMQQSQQVGERPGSGATYANPAKLPASGGWASWISGYGSADWFQFTAQANRTASVAVTALDEQGQPSDSKLAPVIGIWPLGDESGDPAPAATPSAFNTANPGMSRLDAQIIGGGSFRLGVADFRGDGRPDYSYLARLLYSDKVTPARVGVQGGPVHLDGIGFRPGLQVRAGGNSGSVLSASATRLVVTLPAGTKDGSAWIVVTDPASGSFSQMQDALTYGASVSDQLLLLQGIEPATPVNAQAANPIRVRVVAADGLTPVNGATLVWTASNATQLLACSGASSCSVLSDESGEASTMVTPTVTGTSTITALLAPASYPSPAKQQATLSATSSALDLAALMPTQWIAQGATLDVPLSVRVLDLGVPQAGVAVNFNLIKGAATLSAISATTNSSGYAAISAHLANHSADVRVTACVAPDNNPCQTFTLFATPAAFWTLELVSGTAQAVPAGQPFQPLVLRVTDGAPAADPVMGVSVALQITLARLSSDPGGDGGDDDNIGGGNGQPVILGSYQAQLASDGNGLVTMVPTVAGVRGPCDVFIEANAGSATAQFQLEVEGVGGGAGPGKTIPAQQHLPRRSRTGSRSRTAMASSEILFAVPDFIFRETLPEPPSNADADSPPEEAPREPADPSSENCSEDQKLVTNSSCSKSKASDTPKSEGDSREEHPAAGPESVQSH
jgi:hypothetical protein